MNKLMLIAFVGTMAAGVLAGCSANVSSPKAPEHSEPVAQHEDEEVGAGKAGEPDNFDAAADASRKMYRKGKKAAAHAWGTASEVIDEAYNAAKRAYERRQNDENK